jgi:non-specific serine/threonine protein kinase
LGVTLTNLGIVAQHQGDYERATNCHTQALTVVREVGDKWGIAYALCRFARDVALRQGHHDHATVSFKESLSLCREVGTRWISEECLEGLGQVAAATGHYERAVRLFGAAELLRETVGWNQSSPEKTDHDRFVAAACTGLGDAAFSAAWAEGRAMTLEQAIEYALAGDTG